MRYKTVARIMTNLAHRAYTRAHPPAARAQRGEQGEAYQAWTEPLRPKDIKAAEAWSEFSVVAVWLRQQYPAHQRQRQLGLEQNSVATWRTRLHEEGLEESDLPCSLADLVWAVGRAEMQARADVISEYSLMGKEHPQPEAGSVVLEDYTEQGEDPLASALDRQDDGIAGGIIAGDGSAWKEEQQQRYQAGTAAGGVIMRPNAPSGVAVQEVMAGGRWRTPLPRQMGHRVTTIRDAEQFAPLRGLVMTRRTDEGPIMIDARSEWYIIKNTSARINRYMMKRNNIPLTNRIRMLLNHRGREPCTDAHPWWDTLQDLWNQQLGEEIPVKWEVAINMLGNRPWLWLTSHQEGKIERNEIRGYHPSESLYQVNRNADAAVGDGARRREEAFYPQINIPAGGMVVMPCTKDGPIIGAFARWARQQLKKTAKERASLRITQGAVQRESKELAREVLNLRGYWYITDHADRPQTDIPAQAGEDASERLGELNERTDTMGAVWDPPIRRRLDGTYALDNYIWRMRMHILDSHTWRYKIKPHYKQRVDQVVDALHPQLQGHNRTRMRERCPLCSTDGYMPRGNMRHVTIGCSTPPIDELRNNLRDAIEHRLNEWRVPQLPPPPNNSRHPGPTHTVNQWDRWPTQNSYGLLTYTTREAVLALPETRETAKELMYRGVMTKRLFYVLAQEEEGLDDTTDEARQAAKERWIRACTVRGRHLITIMALHTRQIIKRYGDGLTQHYRLDNPDLPAPPPAEEAAIQTPSPGEQHDHIAEEQSPENMEQVEGSQNPRCRTRGRPRARAQAADLEEQRDIREQEGAPQEEDNGEGEESVPRCEGPRCQYLWEQWQITPGRVRSRATEGSRRNSNARRTAPLRCERCRASRGAVNVTGEPRDIRVTQASWREQWLAQQEIQQTPPYQQSHRSQSSTRRTGTESDCNGQMIRTPPPTGTQEANNTRGRTTRATARRRRRSGEPQPPLRDSRTRTRTQGDEDHNAAGSSTQGNTRRSERSEQRSRSQRRRGDPDRRRRSPTEGRNTRGTDREDIQPRNNDNRIGWTHPLPSPPYQRTGSMTTVPIIMAAVGILLNESDWEHRMPGWAFLRDRLTQSMNNNHGLIRHISTQLTNGARRAADADKQSHKRAAEDINEKLQLHCSIGLVG